MSKLVKIFDKIGSFFKNFKEIYNLKNVKGRLHLYLTISIVIQILALIFLFVRISVLGDTILNVLIIITFLMLMIELLLFKLKNHF